MTPHERKKNYSNYVETAITGICIIAMGLFLIGALIVNIIQ